MSMADSRGPVVLEQDSEAPASPKFVARDLTIRRGRQLLGARLIWTEAEVWEMLPESREPSWSVIGSGWGMVVALRFDPAI